MSPCENHCSRIFQTSAASSINNVFEEKFQQIEGSTYDRTLKDFTFTS